MKRCNKRRLGGRIAALVLLLGAAPFTCAADVTGTCKPAVLPTQVTVHWNQLRLADLLPACAPEVLRRRASEVQLGYSPLPGEWRELTAGFLAQKLQRDPLLDASIKLNGIVRIFRANASGSGTPASGTPTGLWVHSIGAGQPLLCRAGQIQMVQLSSAAMTVHLRVRCMDDGVAGSTIRVRDLRRGQIFLATVQENGNLRGELP